jgi:hypothetical protein
MATDSLRDAENTSRDTPLTNDRDALAALLASPDEAVLRAAVADPALDELHILQLLQRKELSGVLLEEIAKRKKWRASYRVRFALAAHPHTPRLTAVHILRDLHLMDLVRISRLAGVPAELQRQAEERLLVQIPQLSLGQKLVLARRGPGRVAGQLIAQGPRQVVQIALDNPVLTEASLLKALCNESLTERTAALIARHARWSVSPNVRVALLRRPNCPVERGLEFVPLLRLSEIDELLDAPKLSDEVAEALRRERDRRSQMWPAGTRRED